MDDDRASLNFPFWLYLCTLVPLSSAEGFAALLLGNLHHSSLIVTQHKALWTIGSDMRTELLQSRVALTVNLALVYVETSTGHEALWKT